MEETVLVKYVTDGEVPIPIPRNVIVDGTKNGTTNQPMAVQTGTHTFDLGLPKDYTPSSITKQVSGTAPLQPLVLTFKPKPTGAL